MDTDTGDVRIDHTDRGILSADYAGRAACYLTFAGFPVTTLHTAVSDTATSIVVQNSTGMKNGDILFVESEQMRINGQVFGSTIDVTRGVNGTTAAAHVVGVTIRGTVTQDYAASWSTFGKWTTPFRYPMPCQHCGTQASR